MGGKVLGASVRLNLDDAATDHPVRGRMDYSSAEKVACNSR